MNDFNEKDAVPIFAHRVGDVPGKHKICYQSAIDDIEIIHNAHSRDGFALGAVLAAEFIAGRKGVYTMQDVLGINKNSARRLVLDQLKYKLLHIGFYIDHVHAAGQIMYVERRYGIIAVRLNGFAHQDLSGEIGDRYVEIALDTQGIYIYFILGGVRLNVDRCESCCNIDCRWHLTAGYLHRFFQYVISVVSTPSRRVWAAESGTIPIISVLYCH